jgi:anti-anti-sigma regulatory factor
LARAIAAKSDVVVDMSKLQFADTSVMLDLAMLARRLRMRERVILLRGAQPQVMMLIELVGLHRLPGVRIEGPTASLT